MRSVTFLIASGMFMLALATSALVVLPFLQLHELKPLPGLKPYTAAELRGRQVYISNGCIYCHSQQPRDAAFAPDAKRGWGRASVAADYYYDHPHLLGTMRTGPDLFNIGARQPSADWHLGHLYQPRAYVAQSIMPSYPYLFDVKDAADQGDRVVTLPPGAAPAGKVVVATPDALDLVAYLKSLDHTYAAIAAPGGEASKAAKPVAANQPGGATTMLNDKSAPRPTPQEEREHAEPGESQTPIPLGIKLMVAALVVWGIYYIANSPINVPASLGDSRTVADLEKGKAGGGGATVGAALFASRCAACHKATGQGLPGVFPPLAGSEWVQGRTETVAAIVLHGITGPLTVKGAKFNGAMPSFSDQLSDAEIAAVLGYVRSQWGNAAPPILAQAVTQVRDATKEKTAPYNGDDELGKLKW